ncbi:hypothetical protein ACCO45_003408 [Purpureocillium lilacinum]|uniref:Uncharacterized protein n=1 Tax=Purpureocillium lilacinum TaxID=33203 RepID=A0ACC4DZT7_PURLI
MGRPTLPVTVVIVDIVDIILPGRQSAQHAIQYHQRDGGQARMPGVNSRPLGWWRSTSFRAKRPRQSGPEDSLDPSVEASSAKRHSFRHLPCPRSISRRVFGVTSHVGAPVAQISSRLGLTFGPAPYCPDSEPPGGYGYVPVLRVQVSSGPCSGTPNKWCWRHPTSGGCNVQALTARSALVGTQSQAGTGLHVPSLWGPRGSVVPTTLLQRAAAVTRREAALSHVTDGSQASDGERSNLFTHQHGSPGVPLWSYLPTPLRSSRRLTSIDSGVPLLGTW